ncbi:alanine--tRNA ligase [Candidatus Korobacter versatilis]
MMTGSQVRRRFLDFFISKGHKEVHSSSLVPANDPTLLFTNAGMNQFKDVFLGVEKRDYNRATTSQKCVRAGGKHNDLENVGFTNRHHTFFEMLGNFSFGDYFKKDAIAYAWELVTSPDWYGMQQDKLYATIFKGENGVPRDDEAYQLWLDVGVPKERVFEMGMKDNFWAMGDTGPCGPCSELHYDMGVASSDKKNPECAAGECKFPCECGRYVEIWNLVFMQFDRDASGTLNPLPKPSIDTGAGLERVTAVMQGVVSNYDTDLFTPLIKRAAELTDVDEKREEAKESQSKSAASLRVIADHSRAATFLISDGVIPANEGRGYVLRKIIRRGIRHGRLLGQNKPFLHDMVYAVRDLMQDAYPELKETADRVAKTVLAEETRFANTLDIGLKKLDEDLASLAETTRELGRLSWEEPKPVEFALKEVARHVFVVAQMLSPGMTFDTPGHGFLLRRGIYRAWMDLKAVGLDRVVRLSEIAEALSEGETGRVQSVAKNLAHTKQILDAEQERLQSASSQLEFELDAMEAEKKLAENPEMLAEQVREVFGPALEEKVINELRGKLQSRPVYSGDKAFKLYDTFGLPLDFMVDAARDQGIEFDQAGFDAAMESQRETARASWKGGSKLSASPIYRELAEELGTKPYPGQLAGGHPMITPQSIFVGYTSTEFKGATVLAIISNGASVAQLAPGDVAEMVLDYTPFYSESGGQIGDTGWLYDSTGNTVVAEVETVQSPVQGVRAHKVTARQNIAVGDKLNAVVNADVRRATMRNHTGTHLLHAALREVLGKHVKQAGSLVDPAKLRFDFSHFTGVADEELQDIEDIVNKEVLKNDRVEVIENVPIDVAVNEYKAMALFGEKYGDRVRVIKIGDFSTELCGGTHTLATGEIGLIKVLHEGSVSSGVRRLEAVTGENSVRHFRKDHELEGVVSTIVRPSEGLSPAQALKFELDRREEEIKKLRKELEQSRMKSASSAVSSATESAREVKGIKVLATRADNIDRNQMRTLIDNLRSKLGSGVIVLGSVQDGKVALIVGVTKDLTSKIQAGKIIAQVAKHVGGSGGGRPDMAEAGGKDPAALDGALNATYGIVDSLLS